MRRRRVDVAGRVADVGGGGQDASSAPPAFRPVNGAILMPGSAEIPSMHMVPGPPIWVSTATRFPRGSAAWKTLSPFRRTPRRRGRASAGTVGRPRRRSHRRRRLLRYGKARQSTPIRFGRFSGPRPASPTATSPAASKKPRGSDEAFQINSDDPRGVVVLEEPEQLGHLHIGHVADGDVFVQADAAGGAGRNQERVAEGAALGEDADSAARVGCRCRSWC